jgi:hypothetical protein
VGGAHVFHGAKLYSYRPHLSWGKIVFLPRI